MFILLWYVIKNHSSSIVESGGGCVTKPGPKPGSIKPKQFCLRGHDRSLPDAVYRGQCKECRREKHLRAKYGIDQEFYEYLVEQQDSECKICGDYKPSFLPGGGLVVDHDHRTGKVRGLLCRECNLRLGYFHDNPELLRKAADYVEDQWKSS